MAKRKQLSVPPSVIKFFIVLIVLIAVGIWMYNGLTYYFLTSPYFKVETFAVDDPALNFLEKQDLWKLRGRSIFMVNLKQLQGSLSAKYPQIAQLKIVKNYPDQLLVQAKKRFALAQTILKRRIFVLDDQGVILNFLAHVDSTLPIIRGLSEKNKNIDLGFPVMGKDLAEALKIIKVYQEHKVLASYPMVDINIENQSKIELTIINNLKIIIDREKIEQKMNVLAVLLTQAKLDLEDIKYLDLRFQEPIIGKKL